MGLSEEADREKLLEAVLTMAEMRNSNKRTGRPRRGSPIARTNMTSKAVIRTPCQSSSLGNSMHSAMADPKSSARSVATIATSARI